MSNKLITQSELMEAISYNPETGEFIWLKPNKYHSELAGKIAGSFRITRSGKMYRRIKINGKAILASHIANMYMKGKWPNECMDHINGDSTDDRWINLREATITQNAWNHKGRSKSKDLPMGVKESASGRFVARIGFKKKMITIGTYDTIQEAHTSYKNKRLELYGEFA